MVKRKEPVDIINKKKIEEPRMWAPQEELSMNEVERSEYESELKVWWEILFRLQQLRMLACLRVLSFSSENVI